MDRYSITLSVKCNNFYFEVYKINERHQLLEETVEERNDETEAFNRVLNLNNCLTPIFLTSLVLEAAFFFLYTNMVTQTVLKYLVLDLLLSIDISAADASVEENNPGKHSGRGENKNMFHVPQAGDQHQI